MTVKLWLAKEKSRHSLLLEHIKPFSQRHFERPQQVLNLERSQGSVKDTDSKQELWSTSIVVLGLREATMLILASIGESISSRGKWYEMCRARELYFVEGRRQWISLREGGFNGKMRSQNAYTSWSCNWERTDVARWCLDRNRCHKLFLKGARDEDALEARTTSRQGRL